MSFYPHNIFAFPTILFLFPHFAKLIAQGSKIIAYRLKVLAFYKSGNAAGDGQGFAGEWGDLSSALIP